MLHYVHCGFTRKIKKNTPFIVIFACYLMTFVQVSSEFESVTEPEKTQLLLFQFQRVPLNNWNKMRDCFDSSPSRRSSTESSASL